MAGLVGAGEGNLRTIAQYERGVDPVAMVVVVVVSTVVNHQHERLLALGPFNIYIHRMAVGGIGHHLALVESLVAHHPASVIALKEGQIAGVTDVRGPSHATVILIVHHLMSIFTVFVHLVVLLIVQEREGEGIVLGHFATEEQG